MKCIEPRTPSWATVAIKVLPAALAEDPERLARFEREAKVLAALNHPNIAAIFGVEDRALVMELVAGENLKGPLPVETALNYARQIAPWPPPKEGHHSSRPEAREFILVTKTGIKLLWTSDWRRWGRRSRYAKAP